MQERNKLIHPFLMVFCTSAILLVLSQFNTEFTIYGIKTKAVNPISEIQQKGVVRIVPLPQVVLNDSIIARDSAAFARRQIDSSNIFDFGDSISTLARFFNSLNETKKSRKKTRIAYFGDSMIEGDLISQDLRGSLQDMFGGRGVGFVPATSVVAGFRTSVKHSFEGWTTYNLLDNAVQGRSLGISGYCFVPMALAGADTSSNRGSSVRFSGVKRKHLDTFQEFKILYGRSEGENHVLINGEKYALSGKEKVNALTVDVAAASVTATFQCPNPPDVYGFSIESDSGVFVDNFSFRGNSGLPLTKISQEILQETTRELDYDLIILEYGLNAVDPSVTDLSWYEKGMNQVIRHIKAGFPDASILLISVGDKSYRKDGTYMTDPSVPLMVKLQKRLAEKNEVAFWSLYDAMGGSGAMIKWVEGDTALANKDYTHFNFRGSHKVGNMLFNKLMSEYNDYNKQLRKREL